MDGIIKENIGQGGLSVDHYTTIVKEPVREPKSNVEKKKKGDTSDSIIMDFAIHNVFPEDDEETQAADPQVQNPPQLKEIASEVQTEGRIQRSTSAGSERTHSDKPSTAHNLTPKILKGQTQHVAETVPRPVQTLTAPTQKVFTPAPANRPVPKLLGTGLISSDEKEGQPSKGNSTGDGFKQQMDFEDYLKGNDLEDLDIEIPLQDPEQLNTNCDSINKGLDKLSNSEEDEDSDEDPFAILNSFASGGNHLTSSIQPVQPIKDPIFDPLRAEKIKVAVSSLMEVLSQNLQAVVGNSESREKLESSLQILKDTTELDPPITVGFKTFIMDIAENLPSMVADLSKASTIERAYQSLTQRKQELLDFGKSGKQRRKSLLEKCRACDDKISALKAKISQLQQELKQLEESRPILESEHQALKIEEQELKQKGKEAIKEYKLIDARFSQMESEYKAMSDLKMSTEAKWDNFRANFKSPFTNL